MEHAIIIDGEVNEKALSACGYDREWLRHQLVSRRTREDEIFLMSIDDNSTINIIKKEAFAKAE